MIFQPESLLRQRNQILRRLSKGELSQRTAIEQLLALWPDDAVPYALQGQESAASGDSDQAEASLWKALERNPCNYFVYSSLAERRLSRDNTDLLGKHLRCLALRKLGLSPRIPDEVVAHYRPHVEKAGADPTDPITYDIMADAIETTLAETPLSSEDSDRLLPYDLLDELQAQASDEVDAEFLQEVLRNSERLVPIWRAALREWAMHTERLSPEALVMVVATLGEMAGPETIDELLELGSRHDPQLTLHAQWAIYRVAARFPDEALDCFRIAARTAPLPLRCAIGEQLVLMPDTAGKGDALASLLEGITKSSRDPDAAHLLMTVVYGVEEAGEEERAERLLSATEPFLAGKARKQLHKYLDSDFLPALMSMGIDELDIEDICLDRALMPADEHEDEDDEDQDELADSGPPAVRPGRNDPCWCGSGKKYKKCHLTSDEESERPEESDDDEQAAGPTG